MDESLPRYAPPQRPAFWFGRDIESTRVEATGIEPTGVEMPQSASAIREQSIAALVQATTPAVNVIDFPRSGLRNLHAAAAAVPVDLPA